MERIKKVEIKVAALNPNRPAPPPPEPEKPKPSPSVDVLGLKLTKLTAELRKQFSLPETGKGVVITEVPQEIAPERHKDCARATIVSHRCRSRGGRVARRSATESRRRQKERAQECPRTSGARGQHSIHCAPLRGGMTRASPVAIRRRERVAAPNGSGRGAPPLAP